MLTDEHAIGEPRTHRRRGEGQAQGGDMRSQAVIRTDRRGDLLRILRPHARVHLLTPIAVGPAVESTFTAGCEIVWDKDRAEFRSEERRVGEECVRKCRSRWEPN